jgi:oligosaccharide repeat unit polymerase
MVAFPFIYFSLFLSYILYKKRKFDISAYLVSLYVISSFFAIMIDVKNLRSFDTKLYHISIVPSILYCFLLTLTIWPFYRLRTTKITNIKLNKPQLFNFIVYFYFTCFLVILISSFSSIVQILQGNLGELRSALARGENITDINVAGIFKPVFITANVFGRFSIIMILFYFYSLTYLKRSKLFNTIILLSSLSIILIGIIGVDRSKVFYWMLSYGFCLVLFWRRLNKKQHKRIYMVSGFILSILALYFIILTVSRFDIEDTGSGGSMISYAGQSFINFSYFFDNVTNKQFSLQRILPLFYKLFIHNGIENSTQLNDVIGLQTGKNLGVFSTFIGDIMVASGRFIAVSYCFVYYFICLLFLGLKRRAITNFHQLIFIFCMISVPMLGIFVDFYAGFETTLALICFLIYGINLRLNYKRRNLNYEKNQNNEFELKYSVS